MKRKQSDLPNKTVESTQQTDRKSKRFQNSGNFVRVDRNQNMQCMRNLDVPLSSAFKTLFQNVQVCPTVPVRATQLTPRTPSVDGGSGQTSHGILQRSCITSLGYKRGSRQRTQSGLSDNSGKKSFMDRLDEEENNDTFLEQMSGDESEEDVNAVAYESDFEDLFDEDFQPDEGCSEQENTDSESEPDIEVVDLTVTNDQDTMVNRNRVKSLAALFEEAFRATEKPSKKALPKEDG
ncbi:hypothetical protein HA466_0060380 [Hirschfeldia incana]|nr:hypothetical protein HA466_0154120 [Hirschfeldia incana]KAJ0259726.1 hypothetical protein HA466_0060380 [Hirschfeldia incana]